MNDWQFLLWVQYYPETKTETKISQENKNKSKNERPVSLTTITYKNSKLNPVSYTKKLYNLIKWILSQ